MNNFEGAALVPGSVCRDAIESFYSGKLLFNKELEKIKNTLKYERIISRIFFILPYKETKYQSVLRLCKTLLCNEEHAMFLLGYISDEMYYEWGYFDSGGYFDVNKINDLTNNGIRDAYLNPEQAAFVNRWGK